MISSFMNLVNVFAITSVGVCNTSQTVIVRQREASSADTIIPPWKRYCKVHGKHLKKPSQRSRQTRHTARYRPHSGAYITGLDVLLDRFSGWRILELIRHYLYRGRAVRCYRKSRKGFNILNCSLTVTATRKSPDASRNNFCFQTTNNFALQQRFPLTPVCWVSLGASIMYLPDLLEFLF